MEPGKNIYVVFSLSKKLTPLFCCCCCCFFLFCCFFFFLFKGRREGRRKKHMILLQRWVFVNTHQNAEETEKGAFWCLFFNMYVRLKCRWYWFLIFIRNDRYWWCCMLLVIFHTFLSWLSWRWYSSSFFICILFLVIFI